MKDSIGQEITEGSVILHGNSGNAGFRTQTVTKITAKRVGFANTHPLARENEMIYLDPENVVVVDMNLKALDN